MPQITKGYFLGDFLYEESKKDENKTIVEIGTWDGEGSTWCILQGLHESNKKDYSFYSLEIDENMYNHALNFLPKDENLHLILGKVTDVFIDLEAQDSKFFNIYSLEQQKQWLKHDLANSAKAPNVLNQIPDKIDLLLLDGGEFQGFPEWQILAPRSKTVVLDDTNTLKFNFVKNFILDNQDRFKIIKNDENDRNGFLIYENI
tara:strand:- start:104 stop:712 length:609 start_codon:yes stop_codon:yes gene_type:complete